MSRSYTSSSPRNATMACGGTAYLTTSKTAHPVSSLQSPVSYPMGTEEVLRGVKPTIYIQKFIIYFYLLSM
jgi:hypothetical protein